MHHGMRIHPPFRYLRAMFSLAIMLDTDTGACQPAANKTNKPFECDMQDLGQQGETAGDGRETT